MKFLAVLLFSFLLVNGFSRSYPVAIHYSFTGIVEGYDHLNKIIVYIDDKKAGESESKNESDPNSLRISVPEGNHEIVIENWVFYQDKWEIHNKENEYSQDLVDTENIKVDHNIIIRILYDLDNGQQVDVK